MLLGGIVCVVAARALGLYVDDRQAADAGMDAVIVVIVLATAAIFCLAAFLMGSLAALMRGRPGESLVLLVTGTATVLVAFAVSVVVGWAIRLSIGSTPF